MLWRDQTSSVHHVHVCLFQIVSVNANLKSCCGLTDDQSVQLVLSQTECSKESNWSGSNHKNICVTRLCHDGLS